MPIALDVHTHLVSIDTVRLQGLAGVHWDGGREVLTIDGHPLGLKPLFHPERLIAWMDDHGVRRAWVSTPPPTYRQSLARALAEDWFGYLNDGLATICAGHPERLAPLFHLPPEHPELAAKIAAAGEATAAAEASAGEARAAAIAGFSIPAGGAPGLRLDDPALAPMWASLDRQGAFVFLHPAGACDPRLEPYYLENLLGNPVETGVAVAQLVFGGVATRHPRIRFCLSHAGGVVPMVAGRWQRGLDTNRPGVDASMEAPLAQLRRFRCDCIAHDPQALRLAASVFGPERLLFGSDWPFPMGLPDPGAQLAAVDAGVRERIFSAIP